MKHGELPHRRGAAAPRRKKPEKLEEPFARLTNRIMKALIDNDITGAARRVLDFVVLNTYGAKWSPKSAPIPTTDIATGLGIAASTVSSHVAFLLRAKVLFEYPATSPDVTRDLGLNKHTETWRVAEERESTRKAEAEKRQRRREKQLEISWSDSGSNSGRATSGPPELKTSGRTEVGPRVHPNRLLGSTRIVSPPKSEPVSTSGRVETTETTDETTTMRTRATAVPDGPVVVVLREISWKDPKRPVELAARMVAALGDRAPATAERLVTEAKKPTVGDAERWLGAAITREQWSSVAPTPKRVAGATVAPPPDPEQERRRAEGAARLARIATALEALVPDGHRCRLRKPDGTVGRIREPHWHSGGGHCSRADCGRQIVAEISELIGDAAADIAAVEGVVVGVGPEEAARAAEEAASRAVAARAAGPPPKFRRVPVPLQPPPCPVGAVAIATCVQRFLCDGGQR